jgi:polysaccharide export outer membrane protein
MRDSSRRLTLSDRPSRWLVSGRLRCLSLAVTLLAASVVGGPWMATAAEPDYRIGPDDILAVSVWDQKDLDQIVTVRPDGKISLPLAGEVEAAGLTVAELTARLTTLYSRTVRAAQVTVGVREIKSRPVFLVGNVVRPGPMQLTHDMTVLQALSAAGGPTPAADLESAFVLRGDQKIPVNLHRMLQQGDTAQNIKLQPRDVISIPNARSIYVQGEVRTPGPVKYMQDLTVTTAIAAAGGFTPLASPRRVTIKREADGKNEVLEINVNDIMSDPAEYKDIPLKPNDIVSVPQRLF